MPPSGQHNYKVVLLGEGKYLALSQVVTVCLRLCGQELHSVALRGGQVQLVSLVHFTGV